jgi:hypothetical protein
MMEFVVRSQCWQSTHTHAVCKEDLCGSINPSGALLQLVPVNVDVVLEALHGSFQGQGSGKKDKHDEVGEQGSEPDNLEIRKRTEKNINKLMKWGVK